MEEITINHLQGVWLGDQFNLIIGDQQNMRSAILVDNRNNTSTVTNNLQLSEVTEDNTRILIFDNNYSIEIWAWYKTEMTIKINNHRYDVRLRSLP